MAVTLASVEILKPLLYQKRVRDIAKAHGLRMSPDFLAALNMAVAQMVVNAVEVVRSDGRRRTLKHRDSQYFDGVSTV